jgi:hypothetical protein
MPKLTALAEKKSGLQCSASAEVTNKTRAIELCWTFCSVSVLFVRWLAEVVQEANGLHTVVNPAEPEATSDRGRTRLHHPAGLPASTWADRHVAYSESRTTIMLNISDTIDE